ncbi:Nem1-Spo7 phosphatase regulatory subunit [Metarhizium acridum]|nr:Nem1-Spo7 phosphatase regulatory subunit [Metarhizium acridum]
MADDIDSIVKGRARRCGKHQDQRRPDPNRTRRWQAGRPSQPRAELSLHGLPEPTHSRGFPTSAIPRHFGLEDATIPSFLMLLTLWVAFLATNCTLAPREDGRAALEAPSIGIGRCSEGVLYGAASSRPFWSGEPASVTAGIRWPRRWFAISNKGPAWLQLQACHHTSSVVGRGSVDNWFLLTYGLFSHTASSSYRHVEPWLLRETEKELQLSAEGHPMLVLPHDDEERVGMRRTLAPGGDYVSSSYYPSHSRRPFEKTGNYIAPNTGRGETSDAHCYAKRSSNMIAAWPKQTYGWLWWLPWRQTPAAQTTVTQDSAPPLEQRESTEEPRRQRAPSVNKLVPKSNTHTGLGRWPARPPVLAPRRKSAGRSHRLFPCPSRNGLGQTPAQSPPEAPSPLTKEATISTEGSSAEGSGRVLRSAAQKSGRGSPEPGKTGS